MRRGKTFRVEPVAHFSDGETLASFSLHSLPTLSLGLAFNAKEAIEGR